MKCIILFLLVSFNLNAQQKEEIVFLYQEKKDSIIVKKDERVYDLGNDQTYRFIKDQQKKTRIAYTSIKEQIVSIDDFLKLNDKRKFPEYYEKYSFYIFIKKEDDYGYLMEVERIWLVEDEIID